MMKILSTLLSGTLPFALTLSAASADGPWMTDLTAAKAQAARDNKCLLIDITGSDWCGWCIRLRKEVFEQPEFLDGVKDNFVLVELDYPKDTSKLAAQTLKQNAELKKIYPVEGYPTILLADPKGQPFAATGYREGGPRPYVDHLKSLLAKRRKRDDALAAARKLTGIPKVEALVAALRGIGLPELMIAGSYPDVLAEITEADPNDQTNFAERLAARLRYEQTCEAIGALPENDPESMNKAVRLIDGLLADKTIKGGLRQQAMAVKVQILVVSGRTDEARKLAGELRAMDPDSETAKQVANELETMIESCHALKQQEEKAAGNK